ncbi:MAG TPA: HD domain-containing protein [Chthoniobacterales bacterium]|jgi:3'-5' exoribonuclease|nr:HD domain-containing protein [Chthoniobacterales bacterium]
MTSPISIQELKTRVFNGSVAATVFGQVESITEKQTRDQKPYFELVIRDLVGSLTIRVWNDHPAFGFCSETAASAAVCIEGEFWSGSSYGIEVRNWQIRNLTVEEKAALFEGPEELRQRQERDYTAILGAIQSIADPRLRRLGELFLTEFGERFRRAAGARTVHHARRGGLIEHVAQMLRTADAIAATYPELNRDLLLAGVLFHDAGKMWENSFPKESLQMPYDLYGELLGHISIGAEFVNRLWLRLRLEKEYESWKDLTPESELVRLHLLHLVIAHHGEKEFGSPVEPKTPEAWALHLVDNLDAKLEIIFAAYRTAPRLTSQILDRVRPLHSNPVVPLPKFNGAELKRSQEPESRS